MPSTFNFSDSRLAKLDGFQVEIDEAHERADIILNRPPYNIVSMPQRDQLRLVFETLDEDPRVRVIVVRSIGEHFSSGGNIGGFMEATPEHVSKLAWNIASPARCAKPVIVANRGYCFGVGFELSLACDFRIASETTFYALPEQKLATECVPDAELENATDKLVDELRTFSPLAQRTAKKLLNDTEDSTLAIAIELEGHCYSRLRQSEDFKEGVEAFNAKRAAKFTGL
jgi:2-oxoglutaroyl-CoA hydrolase